MSVTEARKKALALVKRYGTDNPFELARCLGVEVRYSDSFHKLKGMYTVIARNRFIFLGLQNDAEMNRIVCAHELGHDQLHREAAKAGPMREIALWDRSSEREYEANVFAANLLLSDAELLSYIAEGKSCGEIACLTANDPNLVALKVACLKEAGYQLNDQIYENRFLK